MVVAVIQMPFFFKIICRQSVRHFSFEVKRVSKLSI